MQSGAKLKYDQKYLKKGGKLTELGQWGQKIKIVVWCLSWQQIKAVDSLKLFKNHECLKKNGLIYEKGLF